MNIQKIKAILHSPLAHQCYGAIAGSVLAFWMYQGGSWILGHMQASLLPVDEVQEQTRDARMDRIGAAAKQVIERK